MKNSDLLILGAIGIAAFLGLRSTSADTTGVSGGGFNPSPQIVSAIRERAARNPTTTNQGNISTIPTFENIPLAAQDSAIQYLHEQARTGQSVAFRDSSGAVVGYQDANLGMSYSTAAMGSGTTTKPAIQERIEVSKTTPYINLPTTPYSVPKTTTATPKTVVVQPVAQNLAKAGDIVAGLKINTTQAAALNKSMVSKKK